MSALSAADLGTDHELVLHDAFLEPLRIETGRDMENVPI
jgi:hypothetical protein